MKKFKRYLCVACAMMMFLLTGCGTELYELTAEEETLIIHSAAYFIAKHNIQQKDGVTGYPLPDSFEEESESEFESESENDDTSDDTIIKPKPSEDLSALSELIGHAQDVKITYAGSKSVKRYVEGFYDLEAGAGKIFYVMKLKLTNTTDRDVTINNAAKSPVVKLISDAVKAKSEVTFLSNDFSTYQGTIKAGESVETVLLFEVSESAIEKITSPALELTVGKTKKTIKL